MPPGAGAVEEEVFLSQVGDGHGPSRLGNLAGDSLAELVTDIKPLNVHPPGHFQPGLAGFLVQDGDHAALHSEPAAHLLHDISSCSRSSPDWVRVFRNSVKGSEFIVIESTHGKPVGVEIFHYSFVPIAKKRTKNKSSSHEWTKMSRPGPGRRIGVSESGYG